MTENSDKRDAMIGKIQALLNKAEGKGTTPEESEAFYAKAQALMTKWAIDEEILKMSGKGSDDKIITIRQTIPSTYFVALIHLWDAVARANDCIVLQQKGYSGRDMKVVLTGFESDVATVQLLVTSLTIFAQREAKKESARVGGDYYFRRSFLTEFAYRIGARLREQRDLNIEEAKTETGHDLLPALVTKKKQVDQFMADNFNVGRARGSSRKYDARGGSAGRAAADRADIGNKRVSGNRGQLGS